MTQTKEKSNNTTSSVPSEAKKHDAYDKPGVRRRKAREEAKKNARKNERRQSRGNRD